MSLTNAAVVVLVVLGCGCARAALDAPATPRPPADDALGASAGPGSSGATAGATGTGRPLRILALMTVDTMSHHLWMSSLTVELAKAGHYVESVDVAVPKVVPPTMNVTVIETAFQRSAAITKTFVTASRVQQFFMMTQFSMEQCRIDLAAPSLRRLANPSYTGKFDLIILDYLSECILGFAHRFDYPGVVVLSPFPGNSMLHDLMGNPALPAVIPHSMFTVPHPMSFWHRAATAGMHVAIRVMEWWFRPQVDGILRNEFGEDVPGVEELRRSVHVALVNENYILDMPRPYVPSVIPVGGMHVRPANLSNIPEDIRRWLDDAKHGFIFVSFGSVVKSESIAESKKRTMVESFAALGDVRVLWKMEPESVARLTLGANTRVAKWLPQNDILGHPNILLFVSHCGGLSTQESAYNGVPMLAMPIFADQFVNADKAIRIGMARSLPHADFSRDRFVNEVDELVHNPTYRSTARRVSELLLDQPASPLERAMWWCEYVGRHRGAPHLRSPALDVPWPQVMLLDVIALLVVAVGALALALAMAALACARWVRRPPPPPRNPRAKTD